MKPPRQMYDFSVLRELRKREKLSIADASERSGVSQAVISKIERNQTQAGLDTLYRLGRLFGMNPSDLLRLAENASASRATETTRQNHGIQFREVSYNNIRCLLGTAPAGACTQHPQIHEDNYEVCWILSGCLAFHLPNESLELGPGDSIQFDGILDHHYEAKEDSQFLLLHLQKDKRL